MLQDLLKTTKLEARPYQISIIQQCYDLFAGGETKSILVESPTGSGKSAIGLLLCKLLQNQKAVTTKIGWIAHRRFLLEQAITENLNKNIGAEIIPISAFEKNPPANLDMLVVDEAVHDATASCSHIHNVIKPRLILGLSAFPQRTDRVKLCFDKTIKEAGIHRLIELGYLSKYHHYTITQKWCPAEVFKFYMAEREKWGKTIAYFHTIVECYEFQGLIKTAGLNCEVVTGQTKKSRQLHRFKNDPKINVLANCMMLTEGFDMPALQTVFCRPSCKGLTIQMAGRVFRKHPGITIKNVVQCSQTPWPFLRTATPSTQYIWIGAEWRGLSPNNNAVVGQQQVLKAIAKINVILPKTLSDRVSKRRTISERIQNEE